MKSNLERYVSQSAGESVAGLDTFSGMLMHEVSSPLRAIDGFADLLSREYGHQWDSRGQDYLRNITRASEQLRNLVEDVVRLSQATSDSLSLTIFDLTEMVYSIARELHAREPKRQVETRVADGVSCVADVRLVRMALRNLIGNAWKYTSKNGNALIEFGIAEEDGASRRYYVRDNGVGFNSENVHEIFSPFRRLHGDAEFQGTGMGLAIVERIISRHGGKITAAGVVGAGATFTFSLSP